MTSKAQSKNAIWRRFPRLRFSLRFFCLFILVCGTILGFWASRIRPLQKQWNDAKPIVEFDGPVEITTGPADLPGWMLAILPADERNYITGIEARLDATVDQAFVEAISKLPRVKELNLFFCGLDDQHCEWLAKTKSLESVALFGNDKISDEGIERLLKLPNLKYLQASKTGATWKSHVARQQLELPKGILETDYDGIVKITSRSPDIEAMSRLESPPFKGVAIEAAIANLEMLRLLTRMKEIRLYMSSDVSEEMKVVEDLLKWEQLESIKVYPGEISQPWRKRRCSVELFDRTSQLVKDRSTSATIFIGVNAMLSYELETESDSSSLQRTLDLGLYSTEQDFFESVKPLSNIEKLSLNGSSEKMASMIRPFPNIRSLQLEPHYPGLAKDSKVHFAKLESLEELKIKTHGNYHSLPWDFFEGWKSQNSLRRLHLESKKMWDQPSLKPLLQFNNLESVFVLLGREDPLQSLKEIEVAIKTEKPASKEPDKERFRSLLSTVVANVKEELTPPKPGQKATKGK